MNSFKGWLIERRTKDGMTQSEQAEKIGLSSAGLCHYENGTRAVSEKTLKKIATVYKLKGEDLKNLYRASLTDEEIKRAFEAKNKDMTAVDMAVYVKYGVK